jgi:hypothetical protein
MTGLPNFNRQAFMTMAHVLKQTGCRVFNPALQPDQPYEVLMTNDLHMVLDCTHMVMLFGWQQSKGAKMEHSVAEICGKEIIQQI